MAVSASSCAVPARGPGKAWVALTDPSVTLTIAAARLSACTCGAGEASPALVTLLNVPNRVVSPDANSNGHDRNAAQDKNVSLVMTVLAPGVG